MARDNIAHSRAGNTPGQADGIMRVPAGHYLDPERWAREVALFKRLPLMLALGGELREPSSYKAMTMMEVPVLLTRGSDGEVRAFVNQCSHRGAIVVPEGSGTARRFACPYHAWTYDTRGDLVGVTDREHFGPLDLGCLGLTPLPVAERAGLIFVVLTPGVAMDIDEHLCGYDAVLDVFGFGDWHLVSRTLVEGPNWKVAYDGYLDFYHLPFLHRRSFGPDISNRPIYYAWGPHQRVTSPDPSLLELEDVPEEDWPIERLCGGVWTIFPHVSIAGGIGGGLVSQLFPGPTPETSAHDPELLRRQRTVRGTTGGSSSSGRVPRASRPRGGLPHRLRTATGAWRPAPRSSCSSGATRQGGQRFHTLLAEQLTCKTNQMINNLLMRLPGRRRPDRRA